MDIDLESPREEGHGNHEEVTQLTPRQLALTMLIIAVVGAGLTFWGGFLVKRAWESRCWPVVQGVVLESKVDQDYVNTGEGSQLSYTPRVRYEYEVEGVRYEGDRIAFGTAGTDSFIRAQRIVNRYRDGATIDVRINPDGPADAVLESRFSGFSIALLAVGCFALLVGVGGGGSLFVRRLGARAAA